MTAEAKTLFSEESTASDRTAGPSAPVDEYGPVVFLTNRYNLLEFLSSGMIAPKGAFDKYYEDLLGIVSGRVPLVRGPVDQSLVDAVGLEDATAFPVLVELDPDAIEFGDVPALCGEAASKLPSCRVVLALAPAGVVPMAAVVRTHFRSEKELTEYLARRYENVPSPISPVVTPEFFGEGSVGLSELAEFLSCTQPLDGGIEVALDRADRIAGARVAALLAASADKELFEEILRLMARAARRRRASPIPHYLSVILADRELRNLGADGLLFAAAAKVLARTDKSRSWRRLEILDAIETLLRLEDPTNEDAVELKRNLNPIRGILSNERDFKPFSDKGLISAKALLMVLLRPDVERLLEWPSEESGADDAVRIAACALAGLLRGRKRMPLTLRPDRLDSYLTSLIVARLADDGLSDARIEDSGEATVDEDDDAVWLSVGGTEILRKRKPPPALGGLFADADFEDSTV